MPVYNPTWGQVFGKLRRSSRRASSVTPTLSLTGPLAYTTSSPQGSTTVATVGGLTTGETISSVNVPQLAVSGANIVVGLGTQTVGNLAFVVTTSTGRTIGGTAVVSAAGGVASPARMWAASNQRVTNAQAVSNFQTGTQSKFVFDRSAYFGSFSRYADIVHQYAHWQVNNAVPFAQTYAGYYTIDEQWTSIVTPDGTTYGPVQVTKGGAKTWAVDGSVPFVAADPIPASAFGLASIPKGSYYRTCGIIDRGTATALVQTGFVTSQGGAGILLPRGGTAYRYDPALNAGYTVANYGTGALAAPASGAASAFSGGFVGITATFLDVSSDFNSVTGTGDSITANGDIHFALGWDVPSEAKIIPGLTIGASSSQQQQMTQDATGYIQAAIANGDAWFGGHGANDFFYGRTEAQFRADISTFSDSIVARRKFYRQTYPRVQGTPFVSGTWAGGIATLTVVDGSRLVDQGSYFLNFAASTGWTSLAYPTVITKTGMNTFTIPMATDPGKAYVPVNAATDFIGDDQRTTTAMYPAAPGFGPGSDRSVFNSTGLPALVSAGKLDGWTNTTAVQDPNLSWCWLTDGNVKTYVGDTGTHPPALGMKTGEAAGRVYLTNRLTSGIATAAPVNSVAPAITGTAQEGQVLSASNGTWSNSPTSYAYQWNRNGTPISGSVNATRTVATADVGYTLTCTVTATNAGGSGTATSAATSTVIAASAPVPVNSVAPAVTGTGTVGQTLSTDNGTWTNSPTGYAYQWRRGGVDISGATANTYALVSADAGTSVTCRVAATNAGGTATAISNAIAVAGSAAVTYLDHTFTGTTGADLATIAPTTGGAWSAFSVPGGAGVLRVNTTNAGALYNDAIANVAYINAAPVTADHIVGVGSGLSKSSIGSSGGANGNDILFGVVDATSGNGVVWGLYNGRLWIYQQTNGVRNSLVGTTPVAFTLGARAYFSCDINWATGACSLSYGTGPANLTAGPTVAAGSGIVKPTNPRGIVEIDASNLTTAQQNNTGKHISSIKITSA